MDKLNQWKGSIHGPKMEIIRTRERCELVAHNHGPDTFELRHADGSVTTHPRSEVETVDE